MKRRNLVSGLFIIALIAACAVLGALQYVWNGEVSDALRDRLRASLQATLTRLSRDLNAELSAACSALTPSSFHDRQSAETEIAARYPQWSKTGRHARLVGRLATVAMEGDRPVLHMFDPAAGKFITADWPAEWQSTEERIQSPGGGRRGPGGQGGRFPGEGTVFEQPLFAATGGPSAPFGDDFTHSTWLLFDINRGYVRDALLPEVVQRYLGTGRTLDYDVEVVNWADRTDIVYRSDPGGKDIVAAADGGVSLFEMSWPRNQGPGGPPDFGRGSDFGPGRGPPPDIGRWRMFVRHKEGSLEAVVARTRWRNLSVTGAVLFFMLATVATWVTFTRRAQRLAELQMDFVAGISHELRTPLTVIHTAGYNLQGKLSTNPAQVERYGKLIQKESGRLRDMVEQVLMFASAKAGMVVQRTEPVQIDMIIGAAMEASSAAMEAAHCSVEKLIDAGLPLVEGDARAIQLVLQNLLDNAVKYGSKGKGWVGIFASARGDPGHRAVEIRVADRGSGIPAGELKHIFDPFFRGRRAIEDQAQGTGLGLSLVKKIVEAHGGTVSVRSSASEGTEFVVRLPAFDEPSESTEATA